MGNARVILQINTPGNLSLILQEIHSGHFQWHFTVGSGQNGLGIFRYIPIPTSHIVFYDNRSRVVMRLYGVPSRPQDVFPFLLEDQGNIYSPALSGELDVIGENLPLRVNTYTWSVWQVIPSSNFQTAQPSR